MKKRWKGSDANFAKPRENLLNEKLYDIQHWLKVKWNDNFAAKIGFWNKLFLNVFKKLKLWKLL